MHNRARMITASFLTSTGPRLAARVPRTSCGLLADGDVANNAAATGSGWPGPATTPAPTGC